jgi:hypothetical protein
MRGCLFVVLLAVAIGVFVVVVGLPAVAAGVLTSAVQAAGLQSDDTTVTVSSDPPTDLVGLRADRVRIRATDATFRGLDIGSLDITLSDVSLADRTAQGVSGRMDDVSVPVQGEDPIMLTSITLTGGANHVIATTTLPAAQAEARISDAIEAKLGRRPTDVSLAAPDRVTITVGGLEVHGRLVVTPSGDLVARITDGPAAGDEVVMLTGGEDIPVHLTSVTVTPGGDLRLVGELAIPLLG